MRLRDLLSDDVTLDAPTAALQAVGIAVDSRKIVSGRRIFRARGCKDRWRKLYRTGCQFGRSRGCERSASTSPGSHAADVPFISVPNARRELALAASRLFPRQPRTIVAVTGTSGKTSVAAFTRQIWQVLGFESASIGTIGLVAPSRTIYGSLTTPDPIALHRSLDELAGEGVTHLALEASSHGLDQFRLDGVRIAAGAFTNLSRDHMDYHPTVAHYLAAKLRLFNELIIDGGTAVVAADHPQSQAVIDAVQARKLRLLTVGRKGTDIRLADAAIDGFGQKLTLAYRR